MIIPHSKAAESECHAQRDTAPNDDTPPPTFEETIRASSPTLINFDTPVDTGDRDNVGEPPQFETYRAQYTIRNGSVVSFDPHLNDDGEALYQFLLQQVQTPPTFILHCVGTHVEERTRRVKVRRRPRHSPGLRAGDVKDDSSLASECGIHIHIGSGANNCRTDGPTAGRGCTCTHTRGRQRTRRENYQETVTDFDFRVNLAQHLLPTPKQWIVRPSEPAFRGGVVKEVQADTTASSGSGGIGRSTIGQPTSAATWAQRDEASKDGRARERQGLPPFSLLELDPLEQQTQGLLREWANSYCASPCMLKSFEYKKLVYGWNQEQLATAIKSAVWDTMYTGDVSVTFSTSADTVRVSSHHWLSRWFGAALVSLLTAMADFIPSLSNWGWVARWSVAGCAWRLPRGGAQELNLLETPASVRRGMREGEWFRAWEGTIRHLVTNRVKVQRPLNVPVGQTPLTPEAAALDGYLV